LSPRKATTEPFSSISGEPEREQNAGCRCLSPRQATTKLKFHQLRDGEGDDPPMVDMSGKRITGVLATEQSSTARAMIPQWRTCPERG